MVVGSSGAEQVEASSLPDNAVNNFPPAPVPSPVPASVAGPDVAAMDGTRAQQPAIVVEDDYPFAGHDVQPNESGSNISDGA